MLVDYSDSESDTEEEQTKPSKRRKVEPATSKPPPPLPADFHSLYATNVRTANADDPSLHGGRSRQVPHVEGNWPTHVYLEWLPRKQSLGAIEDLITSLQGIGSGQTSIYSFLKSDLGVQQALHISLSAPLVLRTEHKDAFQDALVRTIEGSDARAFNTTPITLVWVPNLECSRYFLVLKLTRPTNDDLNKLLAACNTCARSWGLDALYAQPASDSGAKASSQTHEPYKDSSSAFHISVAWTLEKPSEAQQRMINGEACEQLRAIGIDFDCVKVKIGNVVTDVPLPAT